jgi:hypothetical protein
VGHCDLREVGGVGALMAGDWIKVEHATLEKPEVALFAELLNVPVAHGIGLLVEFWVWLDRNSRNGHVTHVTRLSIDTVMHTPGFGGALEAVGWLTFDNDARIAYVPNFDRHNSSSAKTRANGAKRQEKYRNASVTPARDKSVTREEKRRVSISTNVDIERSTKAVLQAPTAEHEALATKVGVPCQAEFQKYRDYLAANGKRHRDQDAGFRNWLKKAAEFKPRVGGSIHDKRAATARAMYGDRLAKPDDSIDGTAERIA